MAQVSMTVRMDSQLKQNFDALCQQFGMSANAAMNIFANAVVKTRSIPFRISTYQPEDNVMRDFYEFRREVASSDRPELTMEEINEEIRKEVPKGLLSYRQFDKVSSLPRHQAIIEINRLTDIGLKLSAFYYDEYIMK